MSESGYYAPGCEFSSSAPWNERDPQEIELHIDAYISLCRTTTINSTDAYKEDEDEQGYYDLNTNDVKWHQEYKDQHLTPMQLIDELRKMVKVQLMHTDDKRKTKHLEYLLSECNGWDSEEIDEVVYNKSF